MRCGERRLCQREDTLHERGEAVEIGMYPHLLVSTQRKFRVKLRSVIKPSYKYTKL